jgi:HAE1 family hydrophobic/amphiphilic exporter-1
MRSDEVRPTPPVPDYRRVGVQCDDVLTLSLNDAIRLALENNSDIEVARGDVRVAEGTLLSLEGVYDPVFTFSPQVTNSVTPTTSSIGGAGSSGTVTQNSHEFDSAVTKQFGAGGGQYQFFLNSLRQSTNSTVSRLNPFYSASMGVTFTQPLWRNRSIDAYRHAIRVQRKKLGQTDAEFRLRTTEIINQVQHAYWELVFALHAQKVALDSLNLAREQFHVTEQGVAAGTTAPLGRAEVDTQMATNEANLLAAAKNVTLAENAFKQLVLRDPTAPEWRAAITPTDEPSFDLTPANLDDALAAARANRPELNNLRLQEEVNQLDIQYARDQTRPRIDLVSAVSTTGLAGSPVSSTQPAQVSPNLVGGYGKTLRDLFNFNTRNVVVGVTVEIPFRNRTAEGNLAVARAQRDQLVASTHSQEQAVELDVRNSVQTLETARQTVLTTRRARQSAALQLAGELQLFRAGESTTFLVFQRENALASARNADLRAEADYNNALADLQRATGTTIRANNVVADTTAAP